MKKILTSLILLSCLSTTVYSQELTLPKVKGVIRKIDTENSKITIKHDTIPNIDMPPMTMVFAVLEPVVLNGLAVNDSVLFTVSKAKGVYTVMRIERQ